MQFTTNNVIHRNILLFLRVFFADGGENWREKKCHQRKVGEKLGNKEMLVPCCPV